MRPAAAILERLPPWATTGVGSLPYDEPAAAAAHAVAAYDLPFCPQLPRVEGDMVREWLGADPGRCGWSPARDRERPPAWEALLARLAAAPPPHRLVKLQVTGPVTLARALETTRAGAAAAGAAAGPRRRRARGRPRRLAGGQRRRPGARVARARHRHAARRRRAGAGGRRRRRRGGLGSAADRRPGVGPAPLLRRAVGDGRAGAARSALVRPAAAGGARRPRAADAARAARPWRSRGMGRDAGRRPSRAAPPPPRPAPSSTAPAPASTRSASTSTSSPAPRC